MYDAEANIAVEAGWAVCLSGDGLEDKQALAQLEKTLAYD